MSTYAEKQGAWMMKYPAISDLALKAQKRIPQVSWAYLSTGTGSEHLLDENTEAFKRVTFNPRFCNGSILPKIETEIFGQQFSAPFGIAPVGLTGLMWPRCEMLLASAAERCGIPYTLSTLATETPETVGKHVGDRGWFQLYAPRSPKDNSEILKRAADSGFHTLVITVDIPTPSRREKTKRAGLSTKAKITPRFMWQALTHPSWTIATLQHGLPRLRTAESYPDFMEDMSVGAFVKGQRGANLTWDFCQEVAEQWEGPVLIKGLLHPEDAKRAVSIGMDGIVVSNHGARQFDGAITSIDALPAIVEAVGDKTKIVFDSGVRTGLDVMRALALGADFVLLGRAFIYAVAALGRFGGDHAYHILKDELQNNMIQLGVKSLGELRGRALLGNRNTQPGSGEE
ncbi:MAG: alpha-hydroxy-acid oxidizing protein [Saprospiraceae bacterium]|nr:alpha-hydroxy-acid oxidizing protein [Saprospiraceae bacterium]